MLTEIRNLLDLLTPPQRRRLLGMQASMIVAALLELLNVAAVFPFLTALAQPGTVREQPLAAALYDTLGCTSNAQFLGVLAFLLIALTVVANAVHVLNIAIASHFARRLSAEFAARLYDHYLSRDVLFHAARNSSELASRMVNDTERVSRQFVTPLLKLNARLLVIVAISVLLLWSSWWVTLCSLLLISSCYYGISRTIRRRLVANGEEVRRLNERRLQMISEGIAGLREVKLSESESRYGADFAEMSRTTARLMARVETLAGSPYYLLEAAAISGMVVIVMLLASSADGVTGAIPVSGLFAMAGHKLLPAFQQTYHALTNIRASTASFEAIRRDLVHAEGATDVSGSAVLMPEEDLELRVAHFGYEGRHEPVFDGIDLRLPAHRTIAILGPSGGGKSTLLELILGLIPLTKGEVCVDGHALQAHEFAALRRAVGYVPQSIHMNDATIAENIAFGEPPDTVDSERLRAAARIAGLADWIEALPGGYAAVVGEKGVQLSGGQLQRVGIARALYRDAPILVLDEATAAIDDASEAEIMANVCEANRGRTVLFVTHRLRSVRLADCVVWMEPGRIDFYESVERFFSERGAPATASEGDPMPAAPSVPSASPGLA